MGNGFLARCALWISTAFCYLIRPAAGRLADGCRFFTGLRYRFKRTQIRPDLAFREEIKQPCDRRADASGRWFERQDYFYFSTVAAGHEMKKDRSRMINPPSGQGLPRELFVFLVVNHLGVPFQ